MTQQEQIELSPLDRESAAYADTVASRLKSILGQNLIGVYLHGSAASGDYFPERSDIDILAVSDRPLSAEEKKSIAEQLSTSALPCPATGLEFHLVDKNDLTTSVENPAFRTTPGHEEFRRPRSHRRWR